MSVIQRRSAATATISTTVVLAVILVVVIALVIIFLYRNSREPFRRSPIPATSLSADQSTSRPASCFQPKFPKRPKSPRSSRPRRESQHSPMSSELHKTPHPNYERPVPVTANSKTSVQGSTTRGSTRTTQPLPGTSSMVTMFKVPSSEPVRPLHPTPSKSPPVRKAVPTKTNGVSYPPQTAYFGPSSTATAVKTRKASSTPSPPPQQPHSANRTPTSAGTLRNPTSSSTLRNPTSSSTLHAPVSTLNPQNHTLRLPLSDHDIQSPPQAYQGHPALRHPASSPSLPRNRSNELPPTLHQPLPFPLTSDTTDLSTDAADPTEHANLGYKNPTRQGSKNGPGNQPTQTSVPAQSQSQSHTKPSRPHVNSTYANFLTTRMQNHPSSSHNPHSSSLAALLVGSEAGTTDDGGGPDTNNNRDSIQERIQRTGPAPVEGIATTTTAGLLTRATTSTNDDAIRNGTGGRSRGRAGGGDIARERSVEERYRRFRDTGTFADIGGAGAGNDDDDDDPVGRPWGRFDSNLLKEREREMHRDESGGGGLGGNGNGIVPLRLPIKNPDPKRVVREWPNRD